MHWLALMALRGGSKSIADKNLLPLAGRPLFAWSLEQALLSNCFDDIVVASDSGTIREHVRRAFGDAVTVIDRSRQSASDEASSESIMLEVLASRSCDVMALVQATSPLTRAAHFIEARAQFTDDNLDSLLTAVGSKRFYWTRDARPLNYDPSARPRRQDFAGTLVENGAFYYTRADVLRRCGSRLGGRIGVYEMPAETLVEIDEPRDVEPVERMLAQRRDHLAAGAGAASKPLP